MRLKYLVLYSLCSLLSCRSQDSIFEDDWYAPNFGVIIFEDNDAIFYPNQVLPETWIFDKTKNLHRYSGTYFKHCQLRKGNSPFFVQFMQSEESILSIKKVDNCFPGTPFIDDLNLHRIPAEIKMEFNYISVIAYRNDKYREIRLKPSDFLNAKFDSVLSIEKQLWLLFCSGLSFQGNCEDINVMKFRLDSENFSLEKSVDLMILPQYFENMRDEINKRFAE